MLLVLASAATLFYSCSKYPGFKKSESGFYYKFYEKNTDSIQADTNMILTMHVNYRLKIDGKDSVLFDSKDKPFQISLQKPQFKGDIYEALAMVHQGDSATFIINAFDFFTKTAHYGMPPAGVDSTTMLYFDLKVQKIQSMEQMKKDAEAKAQKLKGEEPVKLQKFLTAMGITQAPTSTGIYIVEKQSGNGRLIQKGDMVKVDFMVSNVEGQKVFSTIDRGQPITFEYGQPFDTKGFDEAISTMKKGSKALVVVPSSMAFGDQGRGDLLPPYSTIVYNIEVKDIMTKAQYEKEKADQDAKRKAEAKAAEVKEPQTIQKYLKDNKITAKPTASGLYYIEKVKGKGAKASNGKKVSVHYTGKLMDGTVFDTSLDKKPLKPIEFTLGAGEVIPGWDEGIALMNEGGKATFIIPSKLAYGASANGKIGAYSPLVFDVELVKVSK